MTQNPRKWLAEVVTHRVTWIAVSLAASGFALVWLGASTGLPAGTSFWPAIASAVGAALIASAVLNTLWELAVKRAFSRELAQKLHLAHSVEVAGLDMLYPSFRDTDIDWQSFLDTRQLDLFVCWANRWRGTHQERLESILSVNRARIRVALPDLDNEDVLRTLDLHFSDYDKDNIRREIRSAISFFRELAQNSQAEDAVVEVWLVPRIPFMSWYRTDTHVIFALYAHRGRQPVPSFLCRRGGFLFEFCEREFEFIISANSGARPLSLTEECDE
jgi:hypothetical protein